MKYGIKVKWFEDENEEMVLFHIKKEIGFSFNVNNAYRKALRHIKKLTNDMNCYGLVPMLEIYEIKNKVWTKVWSREQWSLMRR